MPRVGARIRSGIYMPEMTEATYAEMLDRARSALKMGESVVLDATWNEQRFRDAAARLAAELGADLVQFRCAVADAIAAERLHARNRTGVDASDATPSIAREMRCGADPWPDARRIDTTPPADEVARGALVVIDVPPLPPDRLESLAGRPERLESNGP